MSFLRERIIKGFIEPRITKKRSKYWPRVRKEHLKDHSTCAACGTKRSPEVHHIRPFKLQPNWELNPDNLITLCGAAKNCHLSFGHLGNYKCYNPDILQDSFWFLNKVRNRLHVS